MMNETKLYELDGINPDVLNCLRKYRGVETVGQLLAMSEQKIRCTPMMGAKRYENLVAALNKNGIDHSYSEFYDSRVRRHRQQYADEDISRLPVRKDAIDILRSKGITNIKVLEKMSIGDMIDAGLTEAFILRIVPGLVKWEHRKRMVNLNEDVDVLHVRRIIVQCLHRAGIHTIKELSYMTPVEIERIDGIGYASRKELINGFDNYLESIGLVNKN